MITCIAVTSGATSYSSVFGLGRDGRVYRWDYESGAWGLYQSPNVSQKDDNK